MAKRQKFAWQWSVHMAAVSVAAIALLAGCASPDGATPTASAAPPITVEMGGAALTTDGATAAAQAAAVSGGATGEDRSTPALVQAPATPTPIVLETDTEVKALGKMRIYADADPMSTAMAEYAVDTVFRVIEPGEDFSEYPIEINGVRWYRVRAEDGLVGWLFADGVEPLE